MSVLLVDENSFGGTLMSKLKTYKDIEDLIIKYGYDIISSPGMQSEKKFIQHGNISCYHHSLSVAYMSVWLAYKMKINVDMKSLIRGALLHDYFLYDWHIPDKSHKLHGFHHAKTALENARRDFSINDCETNIILTHMFPLNLKLPRYKESIIVNIADKICAIFEIFRYDFVDISQVEVK